MGRITEAIDALPADDRDDIVFIGLSTESDLNVADLEAYAEREGFPFIYAVMPADYQRALVDDLGRSAVIPPLTPHFTISPDGEVSELMNGSMNPPEVTKELEALVKPAS